MASNYIVAGTVGKFLREELSANIQHVIESDMDPVTSGIVMNSDRVRTVGSLGRPPAGTKSGSDQFIAIHPIVFGRAGAIKYAPIATLLGQDSPPQLQLSPAYQNAADVPQREAEWLQVPLKWMLGNLVVDERQLLALQAGNPIGDFLADMVRDPVEIVRQQLTTDFFGNGTGLVATTQDFRDDDLQNVGSTDVVQLAGRIRPMWRGQRLNAYDLAGDMHKTALGALVVYQVMKLWSYSDTAYAKVELRVQGPANAAAVMNDGDTLHIEGGYDGTTGYGVQGLGNFLVDPAAAADVTLHGLQLYDVGTTTWYYPELCSYKDAPAVERWPTPAVFEKAMDAIHDRGYDPPNRWIISRGIRTLWARTEGLFKVYNVGGDGVQRSVDGGINGNVKITTEGGEAEVVCSAFVPKGEAWGIRTDAFVRYAPNGPDAVRFLGQNPLLGNGNLWFPSLNANAEYTTVFQAPFNFYTEMGCLRPQCIAKLDDLKEFQDVV